MDGQRVDGRVRRERYRRKRDDALDHDLESGERAVVQVDMAVQRTFTELRLDTTTTPTDFPRAFSVTTSDNGTTWSSAIATGTGTGAVVTIPFASQTARFVRVTLTMAATAPWSIYELNVFDTTLSRTGWLATASVNNSTAPSAVDATVGTRWNTGTTQASGQFLQVDMTSPQTFSQITLDTGNITPVPFPRGYSVTTSNDGTTWSSAVATGTGANRLTVINFPTQLARFVRITLTMSNSTPWSVEELNVNGQPTGPITHPRVGWTATGSANTSGNVPANAIDGSTTTRWTTSSAQASGLFFQVDMGTFRTFTQITLDAGTTTNNFPRAWQLQTSSNGTTFTTVTSGTGTAALVTINVPAQTARFIKINLTTTNANPWSIQELNVSGPALTTPGWVATASSNSTGNVPANAIDGSASTRWSTVGAQTNQTFTVDMGTPQVFNQLTLDAGTTPTNFPRGYSVSVSNDGTNWGTAVATGTGTTQLVIINFLTQTARFFRITQTATNSTTWSIQELAVARIVQPCDSTTCTPSDQCHVAGVCDPNTGVCSNPNATNGTNCNDANACTTGETCQSGACTGGTAVTCTADQCHNVGSCVPATGCPTPTNKTNGTTCNDSNACTQTDQCQAGVCTGSNPVVCTASDQCHNVGTCNTGTGVCSNPNKPNGTNCNDGSACTTGEACQSGTCTGGSAVACTADQCHVAGTCVPATGCPAPANKPNGTACNDANACTNGEACQNGACTGGTAVTCTADQCHAAGTCVPATGCPAAANKPNGTACNDGNACTQGDVCTAGTCAGPTVFACAAPDTCHDAGTCNSGSPSAGPPSTQDLIGWWKLDGNGLDSSGGGHNLTNEGAVPAPGRFGLGMMFDGTSCMTAPVTEGATSVWDEARMEGASGVTMMAWVNATDGFGCPAGPTSLAVMGKGWDYSIGAWCYPTDYAVTGGVRPAGAGGGYPGGLGPLGPGTWYHVAVTWDHQNLTIYVNGTYSISYLDAGEFGDVDPRFAIGCMISHYTGDDRIAHFHGAIDEAMLYRRVLSPAEIAAYWTASDPCTHPVHADGTSCYDGNLCTSGDTCHAGTCIGDQPVVCTAPDSCHGPGTCVPVWGCVNPPVKPDGAACNDGQTCTQGETCSAGSCQPPANPPPVVLNLPVDDVGGTGNLGGTYATAEDVNASGQIAGTATDASGVYRAYLRTGTGPLLNIVPGQPSAAASINDVGQVAGTLSPTGGSRAFRYDSYAGSLQDLGFGVEAGGDNSVATDVFAYQGAYSYEINSGGQVAGAFTSGGGIHGFRFSDGVGFEDIGSLQGGMTRSTGLNAAGTVVGSSWVEGSSATGFRRLGHAVRFDTAVVGPIDLNDYLDPLDGWTLISANDIVNDVVVGGGDHGGVVHAYRLNMATGAIDDLSGGWQGSTYASATNAAGDVAGWGYTGAGDVGQAAFVYTDQLGFKKLNDMIDPASGWDLRVATSINAAGDVVGWGYHAGQVSPFKLHLPPGQAAMCKARNTCGGGDGDAICLFSDGVVETSPGHFVAVFGFDNASAASVHPTVNQVRLDGNLVANPQPAPPAYLPPGTHSGGYLPTVDAGHSISWTVGGETVTASASSPRLTPIVIGQNGLGVVIGDQTIVLRQDLGSPTAQPEPQPGAPFNGALTGTFAVSPSGAATYTVPIAIPPGIAGMAPNLSLVYNSQGGDGIAGQGWELAGLSVIHRCPKTKVQDGFGHQVSMRISDQGNEGLCLDGQRLFPQSDDEMNPAARTYKLEQDDHSTITRVHDDVQDEGPLRNVWFKVITKTGETRYYGKSSRTRVVTGTVDPGQQVGVWALERVVDGWGNYFEVHYNNDGTFFMADGLDVTEILYTGHLPTTPSGDEPDMFAHVQFIYEPRHEKRSVRFGSVTLPRTKRLKKIVTSVGAYKLNYAQEYQPGQPYSVTNDPMLPTRLTSIGYCALDDQTCMKPLDFEWDGGGYHWDPADSFAPQQPLNHLPGTSRGTQFVDINGDGRVDIVRSYGESGPFGSQGPGGRGQRGECRGGAGAGAGGGGGGQRSAVDARIWFFGSDGPDRRRLQWAMRIPKGTSKSWV